VTVREKDWEKAIQIVDEEYKNKVVRGSAQWWSLVLGVYKKMQGRKMLRRLKAAGILRKQQIDLLTILAPILTPSFPISIDQLLVDLPIPFTITSLENLAAHYQRLIPQMTLKLEEGQGIPLTTIDELPEWVETFIKAWYTAILCGILDGVFVPQGEAGLKWILQLTANPVLKTFLGTQLRRNLESLNAACRQWQNITLADALSLQHRFGAFKQNNVTMGAFLHPSAIGRVWCVRLHALHNPLFPKEFSPANAHQWWLNTIQTLLPCQYLDEGNVDGWVPLIGGVLNRDDIGALVIFRDFVPTHPSLRIIEVDFDTDYNLIAEVASKVIKQGSRMK
jgi:hypothetical protein